MEVSTPLEALTGATEARERKQRVTLSTTQKDRIKALVAAGKSRKRIAEKYGISVATVNNIMKGQPETAKQPTEKAQKPTTGAKRGRKPKTAPEAGDRPCSTCGASNTETARFCSTCGANIMTEAEKAWYSLSDTVTQVTGEMMKYKKLQSMIPALLAATADVSKYIK